MKKQKQMLQYSSLMVTLLLLSLIRQSHAQYCDECVNVLRYGCKRCQVYCSKSLFSMIDVCDQSRCPNQSRQKCAQYERQADNITQQSCLSQCCGSSPTGISQNKLYSCFNSQQQPNYIIASFIGIVGGIIIISVVGGILYYRWKHKRMPCTHQEEHEQQNQGHDPLRKYSDENTLSSLHMDSHPIKWSSIEPIKTDIKLDESNVCPVCIEGHMNTLTTCGHWFHLTCIYEWFWRNGQCPLCKSVMTPPVVQLFCTGCYRKFVKIALHKEVDISIVLNAIKDSKCQDCQSHNQMRANEITL